MMSDIPLVEHHIMTQHKMEDKNVSTVDKEVGRGGITSYSSTLKNDCPKSETSVYLCK